MSLALLDRSQTIWTGSFAGMTSMAAAMLLLPLGDTLSKLLTEKLNPIDVATARVLAQAAFCRRRCYYAGASVAQCSLRLSRCPVCW